MKGTDHPPTPSAMSQQTLQSTPSPADKPSWNTDKLAYRLGADAISASCAGVLIAPFISIIDRYVYPPAALRDLVHLQWARQSGDEALNSL